MLPTLFAPARLRTRWFHHPPDRGRIRGQSLVEFALTLPILLLLILGGLDFGRVFLGWVSLNNTARIAASFAASNAQLIAAGNPDALARYNDIVQQDAVATNCQPPDPIPAPTYAPSADLGGSARVELTCSFGVITPIISAVLGDQVEVGASAVFPVRVGVVANVPGGGPPDPVAAFTLTPTSGDAPLTVSFANTSTNATSFSWDFTTDGSPDSTAQDPPDQLYATPGSYTVTLTASNGVASSTVSHTVTVAAPPGPLADFTFTPGTGPAPLSVAFTDTSTGTITARAWDFDGDGAIDSTAKNPSFSYSSPGTFTITLTVTDNKGATASVTRSIVVTAPVPQCTVPSYKNQNSADNIQQQWTDAGFKTTVIFDPSRPPEYKITKQSLAAGSSQPCDTAVITVYDK